MRKKSKTITIGPVELLRVIFDIVLVYILVQQLYAISSSVCSTHC
jgi:hypothetical protein